MKRRGHGLALGLLVLGCNGGSGEGSSAEASESSADESSSESGDVPATGLLGCPAGQSCTIVLVAEALDDRVEAYTARGAGPIYRGAIDLDLKPNPMGDNSGENLDEPFGMTVTEQGLAVLLGHYPARNSGSLLVLPHALLAMHDEGTTLPQSAFFAGGSFMAGVVEVPLGEEEPIFVRAHPSGRLLVGVFANDLFALESEWTNPGKVLVVDPTTGDVGSRSLAMLGDAGCAGAWSLVATDDDMNAVALACDGDEGAVILDVSAVGDGNVGEAAAAIDGCVADIPFPDRRVRWVAPDGEGGILVADHSTIADFMDGRLWRFDAACEQTGLPGVLPGPYWEAREIVRLPFDGGARWLVPTGRTPDRGVHVVRDTGGGPEICSELVDLEPYWAAGDGGEVHPYALALSRGGDGLAIGAGPVEATDDMPGYGRVLWLDLDPAVDPCEASPILNIIDLTMSAPTVTPGDPATWRRGPNQIFVQEYG